MDRRCIPVHTALVLALTLLAAGCGGSGSLPFGLRSESVIRADHVGPMAFAPDGRLFYGEQYTGVIRVIQADGRAQADPFATIQVATAAAPDWGLTGLAVDPDFETNHFVYAYFTQPLATGDAPTARPTVFRFTDANGIGQNQTVITDNFPETVPTPTIGFNANGRARFGPDGFLYLSVGDYDQFGVNPERVRSLAEPIGKLLRVSAADGSPAPGNPFAGDPAADPRIFATGFREPFPFTINPDTGVIYGTDNTTGTCEELNIIEAGGNYSWPVGEFPFADCSAGGQKPAIHYFAQPNMQPGDHLSFVEVSGLAFVDGSRYPSLGDSLFVCETIRADPASDGALRRVVLGGPNLDQVTSDDLVTGGCNGDLAASPDGTLYYATETEVRRIVPGSSPATRAPGLP